MNKRILAAVMAACILLLSGCQLAQPEAETPVQKDKLVGVFVTTDYLDLFDIEAYLNDHMDELIGGNITVEDSSQYSNRIYAKFVEETHDGITSGRYVFEDLDGILMASYQMDPHGDNTSVYWRSDVTEGICDVNVAHNSRDDGFDLALSGTIYVSTSCAEPAFYFNPVYQSADGQVYLMAGQSMSFGTGLAGSAAHTLSEEGTLTENGASTTYTSEVKVTMEAVDPAQTVKVFQMDAANTIIRSDEYGIDTLPETLTVDKNAAYILVEEHTAQGIRRSLYQSDDRNLTIFRELENHICVKIHTPIQWPE